LKKIVQNSLIDVYILFLRYITLSLRGYVFFYKMLNYKQERKMKMKKQFLFILILLVLSPICVSASENDVYSTTKYYKTTTVINTNNSTYLLQNENNSYSEEITKEEYDNFDLNSLVTPLDYSNGYIETNYKKMTSSIVKNGSTYRYKVVLEWKTMPSTRSYDIIGIGFPASVKPQSSIAFNQYYCFNNGSCNTSVSYTPYIGVNGVGASFGLPVGSLTTLKQTLYVDMVKSDSSNTIINQYAYGDYSHATKTISYDNARKYVVSSGGIILNSSITNYYDSINTANATWSGTW